MWSNIFIPTSINVNKLIWTLKYFMLHPTGTEIDWCAWILWASPILLLLIFMKKLFHCKCIQMFALSMSMSGCSDLLFAVMLRMLNTSLTRHRGSFTDRKQTINAKYGIKFNSFYQNERNLAKVGPEIPKYKLHIMDKCHVQCVSHPFGWTILTSMYARRIQKIY